MRDYLSMLANDRYSGSSQNQAFHALLFMFEKVLDVRMGDLSGIPRANREERIVDVPPHEIASRLVNAVSGQEGLALRLIYGCGLRLNDCLRLRVKDFDFSRKLISVQESKGGKARLVPMPESLTPELKAMLKDRARLHTSDVLCGHGWCHTPDRIAEKYPNAPTSLEWQYAFASSRLSKDPVTNNEGRHHILDTALQKCFRDARRKLRLTRRYTIHGLRHAWAQYQEKAGTNLSDVQRLLGHRDVQTTMRYLRSGIKGVPRIPSPV